MHYVFDKTTKHVMFAYSVIKPVPKVVFFHNGWPFLCFMFFIHCVLTGWTGLIDDKPSHQQLQYPKTLGVLDLT